MKKQDLAGLASSVGWGRSGKLALYIFGGEIARDLGCAHPLSPRLFEKWRAKSESAIFPLCPLTRRCQF